ncbi:unnamed protein product [Spirodela intermedia]|uniref:Uncharacterized protein n=1 Tax=Spirodela intermedia TaxID=51605 RepID=A0A7I8JF51_SPIIN|nr:unnamed protein product [Spirodela intermedia]CAA6668780.1 unnamed protein product [Spirodela intermedia]
MMELGMNQNCSHETKHNGCSRDAQKTRVLPKTPEESLFKRTCCSPLDDPTQKPLNRMLPRAESSGLSIICRKILWYLSVSIISRVDHGDLRHLLLVSKSVRDAAIISKESHFDFKTPLSRPAFRGGDLLDSEDEHGGDQAGDDDREAPGAPRRVSRTRTSRKDLTAITVALFSGPGE